MVDCAGGDLLRGELGLVFGGDFEGVEDSGQGWLGTNSLDWVFVEEVVDPWDLRDLMINGRQFMSREKGSDISYGCEVDQTIGGVSNEVVDILFLINKAIVTTEAEVGSDVPGNLWMSVNVSYKTMR
jgi:hypothetical protein